MLGLEGPEGVGPPWETSLLLATKGGRTLGPHSYVSESCGAVETQPQERTPTQPTSVAILLPRVFVSASTGPKTGLVQMGSHSDRNRTQRSFPQPQGQRRQNRRLQGPQTHRWLHLPQNMWCREILVWYPVRGWALPALSGETSPRTTASQSKTESHQITLQSSSSFLTVLWDPDLLHPSSPRAAPSNGQVAPTGPAPVWGHPQSLDVRITVQQSGGEPNPDRRWRTQTLRSPCSLGERPMFVPLCPRAGLPA